MNRSSTLLLLLLMLFSQQAISNKIDSLKTDEDVKTFLKSLNADLAPSSFVNYELKPTDTIAKYLNCEGVFRSWDIRNWEKADITNDGLTDLIFIGHNSGYDALAYVDMGSDNFQLFRFSKNTFEDCELVKPIKVGSVNYISIFQKTAVPDHDSKEHFAYKEVKVLDTLVFKFNSFIELGTPALDEIESIEINTSGCYGSCPVQKLKLLKDGKAYYEGFAYTSQLGKSYRKLSRKYFEEFAKLLNYIDVKHLKNNYQVNWTDDQTATLTVTFKDQSKKIIRDYGMQGTFGLTAVYDKLMKLGKEWGNHLVQ